MKSFSKRCSLEARILPGTCFAAVVAGILAKLILGISLHRHLDILDLLIQLALASGFFSLIISGRSSLWTIVDVPSGIRMERDGTVLYEGPLSGIQILDEDRGIITFQSSGGSSFSFPRRRVFHEVISLIAGQGQPVD